MYIEDYFDKLRSKCHSEAFHAIGKKYIFDERIKRLSNRINLLKVFGILVPSAVGGTAIAYGLNNPILPGLITISVALTVAQLIFSIFAVIYKWDDELIYSFEASQEYAKIGSALKQLAEFPPKDYDKLSQEYDNLKKGHDLQEKNDVKHNIQDWENRLGMRFALRENQKECLECKITPFSMKSTKCDICGNFSFKYRIKFLKL